MVGTVIPPTGCWFPGGAKGVFLHSMAFLSYITTARELGIDSLHKPTTVDDHRHPLFAHIIIKLECGRSFLKLIKDAHTLLQRMQVEISLNLILDSRLVI